MTDQDTAPLPLWRVRRSPLCWRDDCPRGRAIIGPPRPVGTASNEAVICLACPMRGERSSAAGAPPPRGFSN